MSTRALRSRSAASERPKEARRSGWAAVAAAAVFALAGPGRAAAAADDGNVQGVWMIEDEVGLAVAPCGGDALCGRIVWLRTPRDDGGRPKRDAMNPDAALRDRPLCGVAVLDGLLPVPDEPGRWSAGSFYDPRDGRSYGLAATRVSADVLMARVYIGRLPRRRRSGLRQPVCGGALPVRAARPRALERGRLGGLPRALPRPRPAPEVMWSTRQ